MIVIVQIRVFGVEEDSCKRKRCTQEKMMTYMPFIVNILMNFELLKMLNNNWQLLIVNDEILECYPTTARNSEMQN